MPSKLLINFVVAQQIRGGTHNHKTVVNEYFSRETKRYHQSWPTFISSLGEDLQQPKMFTHVDWD
jgi:hypothetical protein